MKKKKGEGEKHLFLMWYKINVIWRHLDGRCEKRSICESLFCLFFFFFKQIFVTSCCIQHFFWCENLCIFCPSVIFNILSFIFYLTWKFIICYSLAQHCQYFKKNNLFMLFFFHGAFLFGLILHINAIYYHNFLSLSL